MIAKLPRLIESRRWARRHKGVTIEVVHWGVDAEHNPRGTWNYYLSLFERDMTPEAFAPLWLESKVADWGVTHDHYDSPLSQVDMHGGITFYEKRGDVPGYRVVRIGCDYNHSWDEDVSYSLEEVYADAVASADDAIKLFNITEPAKK